MIERKKFGLTKEGKEASIYILENNNGMHVQVSDFGALILTIMFPDKNIIIQIPALFAHTAKCMMPGVVNLEKASTLN